VRIAQRGFVSAALAAIVRSRAVEDRVEAVAEEIRKEASRRAPKDSGNLARNIAVEKARSAEGVEFHVGWNKRAAYGPLVELGTEDTPPRPHLRPAADRFNNRR